MQYANRHEPISLAETYLSLLQLMYSAVGKYCPWTLAEGSQPTLIDPGRCQILTWSTDMTPGYGRSGSTLAHALFDMARFIIRYEGSLGISRCSTVSCCPFSCVPVW